ncbi:MAG: carboxypeptidase-like regulatory domain-containing protein [Planctomycetota bacterium]|jgi:hypothetical protein
MEVSEMNVGSLFRATIVGLLVLSASAWAGDLTGNVLCDKNGNCVFDCEDIPLADVRVIVSTTDGKFVTDTTTGENGFYWIYLPDGTYVVTLDPDTIPDGATVIWPHGGSGTITLGGCTCWAYVDWLLDCHDKDPEHHCWLTGGGVKFNDLTNGTVAEHGPDNSMGGNIAPSCSLKPGDGGNWNHIAHGARLHFQGTVVTRVECGNVDGIPSGSESPTTGANFIKAWGTGTLKGIKGNKVNLEVQFFLYCEDRNEPGSHGAKDGALVDRYFLHVYTGDGPTRITRLLIARDDDPTQPVTITGGNLQIHASSCDDPPPDAFFAVQAGSTGSTGSTKGNNGKKK